MKKILLVFLAGVLLIASACSCSAQPFSFGEESTSRFDKEEGDMPFQNGAETETHSYEQTTGNDGAGTALERLEKPSVTFTRVSKDVQPYSELVYIQASEEGFFADGFLMFESVRDRLPDILKDIPDIILDPSSKLNILAAPGVSVQPEIRYQLYGFEDYRFVFEADSLAEIAAYCQSAAEHCFYLYFSVTTVCEAGTRRDAYFARISIAA